MFCKKTKHIDLPEAIIFSCAHSRGRGVIFWNYMCARSLVLQTGVNPTRTNWCFPQLTPSCRGYSFVELLTSVHCLTLCDVASETGAHYATFVETIKFFIRFNNCCAGKIKRCGILDQRTLHDTFTSYKHTTRYKFTT